MIEGSDFLLYRFKPQAKSNPKVVPCLGVLNPKPYSSSACPAIQLDP